MRLEILSTVYTVLSIMGWSTEVDIVMQPVSGPEDAHVALLLESEGKRGCQGARLILCDEVGGLVLSHQHDVHRPLQLLALENVRVQLVCPGCRRIYTFTGHRACRHCVFDTIHALENAGLFRR